MAIVLGAWPKNKGAERQYEQGTRRCHCGKLISAHAEMCRPCHAESLNRRRKELEVERREAIGQAHKAWTVVLDPCDAPFAGGTKFTTCEVANMLAREALLPGTVLQRDGIDYRVTTAMTLLGKCGELMPTDNAERLTKVG